MRKNWLLTLGLSWLLAFALGNTGLAQDKQELTQPKVPLEQLLNRDGTLDLNRDFRGSLDPAGWQMMTAPNGEPRFVPASMAQQTASGAQLMTVPGDENWDGRFFVNGVHGGIHAFAVDGSGTLYVGGSFLTVANGIYVNNIAKWDGSSWSALGSGVNNYVSALDTDDDGNVYAGGYFTTAGGIGANYIAKWNGSSWSALGSGVNSTVMSLIVDGSGSVYAGGYFTTAGGISANNIAKWDGTDWSALGTGMNDAVHDLKMDGSGHLYASGRFTIAGGVDAKSIAKWDGSSWSALDSGTNWHGVSALAVDGSGNLYAAGSFSSSGGFSPDRVAKWNGTNWLTLGSGMNYPITALAVDGSDNVYAGGWFTTAGGVAAKYVAKWNGSNWSPLGSDLNYNVIAELAVDNDDNLFVAGSFTAAGGVSANKIAKWDGSNWSRLGPEGDGLNGIICYAYDLALDGSGNVYVAGRFTFAGGVVVNNIAKWDGNSWSALGSGMNSEIVAVIVDGSGNVYAGGYFTTAGGVDANYVAKWDGSSWSALGSGTNFIVRTLAVDGDDNLYVGGWFTMAGGLNVNYIAKWDGSNWSALAGGTNGWVLSLAMDGNGNVYAGGRFDRAGGGFANNIAKWNGSSWSALGNGIYSWVHGVTALVIDNSGNLYAGGNFTNAGSIYANYIAKWDGSTWSALSSGLGGVSYPNVYDLAIDNMGNIYAGGYFTSAGGVSVSNVAKWNGSSWSALGSGINGTVNALKVVDSRNLYVAGNFTIAGGKPSFHIGRYSLNQPPTVDAYGPYSVNEDASVTVNALGSDPENGPLTYTWDIDNNGSFETSGQSVNFSAVTLDGPGSHIITVQVTDNGGLTATDQATVNVSNVAPTATFAGTPSTIIVGQSATLAFSNQADPSAADVTAGFTYSYDCTNDGNFEISDVAATTSYTCPYPVSGPFTATGRIKDKDGGFTDYTVQVVVQTSQQATGSLINQIQALIDAGTLNQGQGGGLIAKLEAAIQQLNNGNTSAAINQLRAFINQVNDFMSSTPPILTAAEGQPLIDAANAIIAAQSATGKAAQLNSSSSDLMSKTEGVLPTGYRLEQNSPNPFNPVTRIQFSVPRESYVRLKVYNSFGAEVATLVDQQVAAGTYKVNWDASRLASGFYLYRLEAEGFAQTKKLLLMK